jgi:hypothetical protein
MKLWIDDIRNAPDESWSVARDVTSAINFIARFGEEIEEISFDHDISYLIEMGGMARPYPSPETFQAVANYAAEYYGQRMGSAEWILEDKTRPKVQIHTANPAGAKALEFILEDFNPVTNMMGVANRLEMEV